MEKIRHFSHKANIDVDGVMRQFDHMGFQANKLASATNVIESMIRDKDCKVFLGVAGALVPAGMKNIIIDMIEMKWIDVLVISGANLTHDMMEDLGYSHYLGNENMDDYKLFKDGLVRMFNTIMPNKAYEDLERFFNDHWNEICNQTNVKNFLWKIGQLSPGNGILKSCFKSKTPIFCPGISDCGIGLMVWGQLVKGRKVDVNAFEDLKDILDLGWTAKKSGVIYLGGGAAKNYIQQAMQFSRRASFGVQITMDRPDFGGSSGAELREGISWGKLSNKAQHVNLACDISIALPLIYSSLKKRLES